MSRRSKCSRTSAQSCKPRGLDRVLKMTVYISDISLWGKVNEVYARMLGDHRPARAIVPVKELHYGFQIEIEAIAALKTDQYRER